MKKFIAALALLAISGAANAISLELVAHNQRSGANLSTLKWKACAPTGATNPCLSTTNTWTLANQTPSNATWDWNPTTGVLTSVGLFQTTSHISSNANGSAVISDKVTDMVINTQAGTTTASSYNCVEGNFLGSVGASGCVNVDLGPNFVLNSTVAYNVGGNANCINRTINPDDFALDGNVRGLSSLAAGGGCDATDGAFPLYTIVTDTTNTGVGGQLILSNGVDIAAAGTNYLTFTVVPAPAAVWLLGTAVGGLGLWRTRKARAAA